MIKRWVKYTQICENKNFSLDKIRKIITNTQPFWQKQKKESIMVTSPNPRRNNNNKKKKVFGRCLRPILINRTAILLANQVNGGGMVRVYGFPLEEIEHIPLAPLFGKVGMELRQIRIDPKDDYLSNEGAPLICSDSQHLLTGHPATARALRKWTGIRPQYVNVPMRW